MLKWLPKQEAAQGNGLERVLWTKISRDRQDRPMGHPAGDDVVSIVASSDSEKEWPQRHNYVVRCEPPFDGQEGRDGAERRDETDKRNVPSDGHDLSEGATKEESTGRDEAPPDVTSAGVRRRPQQDGSPVTRPQVLGAMMAALSRLGSGCAFGYSALPDLAGQPDLLRDHFHASLFDSVTILGAAAGSLMTACPQVWLGQRTTILLALPVALVAWVTLAVSLNVWVVLAARVLQGLALGIIAGPSNNYVAEVAHSSLRGMLMATLNTSEQAGYLLVYAIDRSNLTWRQMALVCGFFTTAIPFMGFLLLPDSPRWLAYRGRLQEAHESLSFFRGSRYDSSIELSHITHQMKTLRCTARDQLEEMEDSNILSKILLLALLLSAFHFTGNFVVGPSIVSTFRSVEIGMMNAVVVSIIGVLGTVFYMLLVEHIGRKPLFLVAFLASAGALAMLGSSLYDRANSFDVTHRVWLPFASLATFSFFINIGFSVLSLSCEEILPTSVRSTAVALLFSLFYIGAFLARQTYPTIAASLGEHGAFWLYCSFSLFVAVVGGISLPETCGRSLEDITAQYHFKLAPISA